MSVSVVSPAARRLRSVVRWWRSRSPVTRDRELAVVLAAMAFGYPRTFASMGLYFALYAAGAYPDRGRRGFGVHARISAGDDS
jgi:hypothetical protein